MYNFERRHLFGNKKNLLSVSEAFGNDICNGTTSNGITFKRTLGAGVYSKLEFYYYTNHNCMYNKSNITYSVTYHFE